MNQPDDRKPHGTLTLIKGCMFSRKTTQLIQHIENAKSANHSTLAVKHAMDNRYADENITTHDGKSIPAVNVSSADQITPLITDIALLAVDEAHFFGPSLIPVVDHALANGTDVVVAGVDIDATGHPFPPFPELEQRATQIIHTHAVCAKCNAPAYYTQRLVNDDAPVIVGGADLYEPRCKKCFVPVDSTNPDERN